MCIRDRANDIWYIMGNNKFAISSLENDLLLIFVEINCISKEYLKYCCIPEKYFENC